MISSIKRDDDGKINIRFLRFMVDGIKLAESEDGEDDSVVEGKMRKTIDGFKERYPNRTPQFWEGMLDGIIMAQQAVQSIVAIRMSMPIPGDDGVVALEIKTACLAQLVIEQREELAALSSMEEEKE